MNTLLNAHVYRIINYGTRSLYVSPKFTLTNLKQILSGALTNRGNGDLDKPVHCTVTHNSMNDDGYLLK